MTATRELLAELGDADRLSLRAVAAAVGVTPPSIYRHFPDKTALLAAVLEGLWAELHVVIASEDVDDPFSSLRAGCLAYLGFAEEHPGHYRALFSAPASAEVTLELDTHPGTPTFLLLVGAIERCLERTGVRDGDPWALATRVWVTLHGLVDLRITLRVPFPWPAPEAFVDALLADLALSAGE